MQKKERTSRGLIILFGILAIAAGIWFWAGSGVIIGRNENQNDKNREFGIWTPGMTFEQSFTASQENLCRIDFALDSYHAWETPLVEFRLYELPLSIDPAKTSYDVLRDNRREIRHVRINGWLISPHMFNSVSFAAIPDSQGKHYLFTLEVPEVKKGGSSILLGSPEDRYEEGHFFVNGEQQQGDLAFRALYKSSRIHVIQDVLVRFALQKPWPFSHPAVCYGLFGVYAGGIIVLIGMLIFGILGKGGRTSDKQ